MGIAEFYPPVVERLKGSFEVAVKMALVSDIFSEIPNHTRGTAV